MATTRIPLEGATVEVRSAAGRYDGFFEVVGVKKPGGHGCWCMAYRDSRVPLDGRAAYMEDECAREPGPGVVAYVDDVPAGWCSIAPRSTYRRLMTSRTIPLVDDRDPWSIVCFVVRPPYRGQGLMHVLLEGALAHARAHGATVVESYPVDSGDGPEAARSDVISAHVGSTRLFERAGFTRVAPTTATKNGRTRWIMRTEL